MQENKDQPQDEVAVLLAKKIRSLKKKLEKASKLEEKANSGVPLTEEQKLIVKNRIGLEGSIKELTKFGGEVIQINAQEQKKREDEIKQQQKAATEQAKLKAKEQPKEEAKPAAPVPSTPSVSEKELAQRFVNLIHFHTNGNHDLAEDFSDNELEASHRLAYFISYTEENPSLSYTLATDYLTSSSEYHDGVTFKRIREVVHTVSQRILSKHAPTETPKLEEEKPNVVDQKQENEEKKSTWFNDMEQEEKEERLAQNQAQMHAPAAEVQTQKSADKPAEMSTSAQEFDQSSENAPTTEAEFRDQTGRSAVQAGRGQKKFRGPPRGRGDRQDRGEGRGDRGEGTPREGRGEGGEHRPRGEGRGNRGGERRGGDDNRGGRGGFRDRAERGEFRERPEGEAGERGGYRGRGGRGGYRGRGSPRPEGEGQQNEGFRGRPNRGGPARSPRIPNEKSVPGQGQSAATAPTPVAQQ